MSSRCQGITASGSSCRRKPQRGKAFCYQHLDQVRTVSEAKTSKPKSRKVADLDKPPVKPPAKKLKIARNPTALAEQKVDAVLDITDQVPKVGAKIAVLANWIKTQFPTEQPSAWSRLEFPPEDPPESMLGQSIASLEESMRPYKDQKHVVNRNRSSGEGFLVRPNHLFRKSGSSQEGVLPRDNKILTNNRTDNVELGTILAATHLAIEEWMNTQSSSPPKQLDHHLFEIRNGGHQWLVSVPTSHPRDNQLNPFLSSGLNRKWMRYLYERGDLTLQDLYDFYTVNPTMKGIPYPSISLGPPLLPPANPKAEVTVRLSSNSPGSDEYKSAITRLKIAYRKVLDSPLTAAQVDQLLAGYWDEGKILDRYLTNLPGAVEYRNLMGTRKVVVHPLTASMILMYGFFQQGPFRVDPQTLVDIVL